MNFLKKLFPAKPSAPQGNFYTFTVKCNRCGENIAGRINLANDLSLNDEGSGYFVRKVVMGGGRCFQQVEVELTFDAARRLIESQVNGGTLIES
ncbi:MAG: hypothetical protein HY869_16950 [Chloroflexi bacterium]|nr:hypothetical protein [Chloroflexota bacterium]